MQREFIAGLGEATLDLRDALLALAGAPHGNDLRRAHAHAAGAADDDRALPAGDHRAARARHRAARRRVRVDQSSIRSARARSPAPGFPIDRNRTSELLGFSGPTGNTYGSIATVDYLLESVSATSVLIVGLGRVVQDLLLWCTMEFGYLRLSDGFVQGSSIMPQKRNPVALEHARAIGSKAVGQAQAIVTTVHNTPFGDIVDTEDDLQPLVASMFRDATRMVTLVAAAMRLADFDVEKLASRAARRRHHADRAGRHAGARSRPAVPLRARDCGVVAEGAHRRSGRGAVDGAVEGVDGDPRPAARLHRSRPADAS